jgi:hypothetical protein
MAILQDSTIVTQRLAVQVCRREAGDPCADHNQLLQAEFTTGIGHFAEAPNMIGPAGDLRP